MKQTQTDIGVKRYIITVDVSMYVTGNVSTLITGHGEMNHLLTDLLSMSAVTVLYFKR